MICLHLDHIVNRETFLSPMAGSSNRSTVREFPHFAHFGFRYPNTQQDHIPDDQIYDDRSDQNTNDIGRDNARRVFLKIQEIVNIETLGCVRKVSQSQVQSQENDDGYDVQPWQSLCTREDDFEKSIERIESMLRCIGPESKRRGKTTGCEYTPIHGCYTLACSIFHCHLSAVEVCAGSHFQRDTCESYTVVECELTSDKPRIYDDRRVEHAMRYLQGLGPARQEGSARQPIAACMYGAKGEIECQPPVGQMGKVGEGVLRGFRHAMAAVPTEDEK
jgi:hypothetical protein